MMVDSQKALENSHAFGKQTLARLESRMDLYMAIIEVHMLIVAIELWASLKHACETHLPCNVACRVQKYTSKTHAVEYRF